MVSLMICLVGWKKNNQNTNNQYFLLFGYSKSENGREREEKLISKDKNLKFCFYL